MLGHWDILAFHFINRTLTNKSLDMLMPLVTWLGSGEFIFISALLLIVFGKKNKIMAGILLLAGLTVTYFAVEALKSAFEFPRPFMAITDVRLLVPQSSGFSFPSGHSVTAFMAATIVVSLLSRNITWFVLAFLVAFSRVYVGMHYVSDVIAGAFIGIIIGYALVLAYERKKRTDYV